MYPEFLATHYSNKLVAKFAREIVHRVRPDLFFSAFMKKQSNPFPHAAYSLTFDFDFEKDIEAFPVLLDKLSEYKIKAGFAVIGKFVEKYPDIHLRAVDEGHEIINHTYTHPDNPHWAPNRYFNKLSYSEQYDEIYKAHDVFNRILKINCVGFRTPHYGNLHCDSVYPILRDLGYLYSSSTAACCFSGYGAPVSYKHGIVEIPTGCSLHFPLAIFDSWNMLRKKKPFLSTDEAFCEEFENTIAFLSKNDLFLTHYFDPYDIVENSKIDRVLSMLSGINTVLYRDIPFTGLQ